jgi:SAM-dependent methyltransferase
MRFETILKEIENYYTEKVKTYGPTAKGVDWNSTESQTLRFEQLLKVCDPTVRFTINDYGCGYGALLDYLNEKGIASVYHGFDLSAPMIAEAKRLHQGMAECDFSSEGWSLSRMDYTVASGIFNVKLDTSDKKWKAYMLYTLNRLSEQSAKGFAFNALTTYSDPERRRPDLYYADPLFLFDYCKQHFSKFVALLHDYPLYEFTILVRK